jgi:hypothetical protein
MAFVIVLAIFVLIALIVLVVGAPLREAAARRAAGLEPEADTSAVGEEDGESPVPGDDPERDELEAAREAKYREIRDAELDYRTGKLSEPDYRELDAELRAEALVILDALEEGVTPTDASATRSRSRRTRRRRRPSSD